jgi:beta-glucanase (GH16 family)
MKLASIETALFLIPVFAALFVPVRSIDNGKAATKPGNTDEYKLVWADEFNIDGPPDARNWAFEKGFVRNDELQWYQEENAYCEKGMLVIEGRRERRSNPGYVAGSNDWKKKRVFAEYTASSIQTAHLHSWKYGRFVMRGRIDVSPGLWPAFWTLGVAGEWPSNGEIDIMEYYRNMLLANIACGTSTRHKAEWFSRKKPIDSFPAGWARQFHVWRMDWDEEAISLFVDDELMIRTELSKLNNKDAAGLNPFRQPHYILLNLAIGGTNGGNPAGTRFPNRFEVDYVRVYQK